MPETKPRITDAELEVMQVLWNATSPLTLAQIKGAMPEKNGETTKTLLRRLCQKGAVAQEKREVFRYRPLVEQKDFGYSRTQNLIDRLFDGSARAMVASLVEHDQLRPEDVRELRDFFEQLCDKEEG